MCPLLLLLLLLLFSLLFCHSSDPSDKGRRGREERKGWAAQEQIRHQRSPHRPTEKNPQSTALKFPQISKQFQIKVHKHFFYSRYGECISSTPLFASKERRRRFDIPPSLQHLPTAIVAVSRPKYPSLLLLLLRLIPYSKKEKEEEETLLYSPVRQAQEEEE